MTDSQNPYEVLPDAVLPTPEKPPSTLPEALEPTGTFLVVTSGVTVLPQRCVYSNEPTADESLVQQTLKWSGRSFRPSLGVHRCEIQYYVSAKIRNARKLRLRLLVLWIVPCLAFAVWLQSWLIFALTFLIPHIVEKFMSVRTVPAPPLSIADYRDGRFWIHGCCTSFLLQLREELNL
ncbi:MAG: hypothetical protein AB8G99_00730 [Planctomycetaceae bacterium]